MALICPTAPASRWQGRADICVEVAEPIITSLLLLWLPLDVHLLSPKPSLKETIASPTHPFELTRWGRQRLYELSR